MSPCWRVEAKRGGRGRRGARPEPHTRYGASGNRRTRERSYGRWPMLWPMADAVAKGGIGSLRAPC
eukprot:127341-Prymnesium_polylepis.1